MAPKGQALCGELADGCLFVCMHPERMEENTKYIREGFERRPPGLRDAGVFDLAPNVAVVVGDDLDACRNPLRHMLALYVGGMGARSKNFYNEYVRRVGFEEEAIRIQDLYLDGKKGEAANAVTDEMVDAFNLVGPPERIKDQFARWQEAGIGTMLVGSQQVEALRLLAELNA